MSPIELLSRLRERRVELIVDGDRLRVRAPEGALTPDLKAEIASRKASILALLRRPSAAAQHRAAAPASGNLPPSFAQERFWFLEQLEKGTSAYHLLFGIRFEGALDVEVLRQTLQQLTVRHAALRTGFVDQDGRPRQVIADQAAVDLRVIDLQHHPEAVRYAEALAAAHEASREPFDLRRPPLMRTYLLRIAPDDHILVFVLHHIVSDGWSVGVLMRDFAAAYRGLASGATAPLPPLPVQYADFSVRQRAAFAAGDFTAQTDYWKQQLADLPTLNLSTDRPRPAALSVRGAEHRFAIDKTVSESLVRFSTREGVTLFMTLFAAFQALLHRYTQQEDLAIGTAIAGRNAAEFEEVVGPFINTLVLRTSFAGCPTFRETLRRVRGAALDAYANQDVPFERLVDELQPERDLSRNPLCQVIFALQNVPAPEVRLDGLALSVVPLERVTSALDMDWMVYPTLEGLHGTVRYSTDLFDAGTVERMAQHYVRLLESAVTQPDAPVANLRLLDEAEHRRVTRDWNTTGTPYPADASIAELFERQVERRPAAVAVASDDEALTYAELNERANRLAHVLIENGVGPDGLVGVFQERSVDAVVSMVGILKAGGAYLPLDPAYPQERLALMLGDGRPRVVLTRSELASRLPEYPGRVLCVDTDRAVVAQQPASNPGRRSSPDHLAYVTYTSGSTGTPKGVEVRQRGVTRLLFGVDYVHIAEDDCILQLASISFDASTLEIWGALLHGARLAVLAESVPTPDMLGDTLRRHGVTILWLTASFFNAVIDAKPGVLSGVRQLLIGGEALSVAHVRRAQAALPETQIINGYGPTESTTFTCCYPIPLLQDRPIASIPIGRPIGNTTVYVLDSSGQPSPVGVPGELLIGGDGLARGYLNHPALTAEKFVPDPFSQPGARLYRTGDIVRYLPDGLVQFLGRNDNQVKIRGFRVEPGEVEQVLRQHPAVREAAVLVQEQSPTSRRLVAYVTAAGGETADRFIDDVRQFAQSKLPAHMVPSAFVALVTLPLTAHGKLDRRALPDPEPVRRQTAAEAGARSAAEQALAGIWTRVLRLEQVGVDDDFFELGGDSILSLQVVAKARDAGLKITPRQIFEHPTIAELARVAEVKDAAPDSAPAAGAADESGDIPLTPIQRWFFEQAPGRPEHFNHAVLLGSAERIDAGHLRDAVAAIIARHDALRLRFSPNGDGQWHQQCAAAGDVPFTTIDLSAEPADTRAAAIERHGERLQASLDLARGPILHAALFDLGASGSRVLLVVHHLAIDAVSWRIVMGDLQVAYEQLRNGQAVRLPPPTTSFGTWSHRLGEFASASASDVRFWAPLADVPVPACPVDHPAGENSCASERTIETWIDADDTHALLHDVPRKYGMRVHEIVLTAVASAWADWTAHRTLLVDVEGHGREAIAEDVDLSATVGWFTSIYPVSLNLERTKTPGDELKRVKEQLRQVPGGGLSYGVLRYLSPDASLRRRLEAVPTPEVSFNFLGQFDGVFSGQLFAPAAEPIGPMQSPGNPRAHLVEISARVLDGRLHVACHYSANLHERATIERLAARFVTRVRDIVGHCQSPEAGAFTPSDFPQAKVSQDQLDRLMARINAGGKS